MKRAGALVRVVAVFIACGAAMAQDFAWEETPTGRDFAQAYPPRAEAQSMPGMAILCCAVNEDRRLDCQVGLEAPEERGFGRAALQVSRRFRVNEATQAHYRDSAEPLQLPLTFSMGEEPRARLVFEQITQASDGLCKSLAEGAAPHDGAANTANSTAPN